MNRAQKAVADAMNVVTFLESKGEPKMANDIRRLCKSNAAYRGTLQQLHRDNMTLRGVK